MQSKWIWLISAESKNSTTSQVKHDFVEWKVFILVKPTRKQMLHTANFLIWILWATAQFWVAESRVQMSQRQSPRWMIALACWQFIKQDDSSLCRRSSITAWYPCSSTRSSRATKVIWTQTFIMPAGSLLCRIALVEPITRGRWQSSIPPNIVVKLECSSRVHNDMLIRVTALTSCIFVSRIHVSASEFCPLSMFGLALLPTQSFFRVLQIALAPFFTLIASTWLCTLALAFWLSLFHTFSLAFFIRKTIDLQCWFWTLAV